MGDDPGTLVNIPDPGSQSPFGTSTKQVGVLAFEPVIFQPLSVQLLTCLTSFGLG